MKIVVIGLGSMGKRRIRCLQALGVEESSASTYGPIDETKLHNATVFELKRIWGSFGKISHPTEPSSHYLLRHMSPRCICALTTTCRFLSRRVS